MTKNAMSFGSASEAAVQVGHRGAMQWNVARPERLPCEAFQAWLITGVAQRGILATTDQGTRRGVTGTGGPS
jgi:hypothetical protein